jgi:hypothetical protein
MLKHLKIALHVSNSSNQNRGERGPSASSSRISAKVQAAFNYSDRPPFLGLSSPEASDSRSS